MAIEKITQSELAKLYQELDEELAKRNGFQSIADLAPEGEEQAGTYYGDVIANNPNELKARVQHINRALKARQHIASGGDSSFEKNTEE